MTNTHHFIALLGSICIGAAAYALVRVVTHALTTEDLEQDDQWRYDVNRINELRRISPLYRLVQPVIQGLAAVNRRLFREQLPGIGREIHAAGLPRFWTPAEYLARLQFIALLMLPLFVYACTQTIGTPGIVPALLLTTLTAWLLRRRLAGQAQYRLFLIKRRLPFVLDLLTLLMEAGSTFLNALRQVVDEFHDQPVGVEFGRVLAEMSMGKSRIAALEAMRERLHDDEITGIIGSIIHGEQLGTPLARIFRTQADVLRLKRSQRAETIAGEAGVKMLAPAVLVMAATVIIILGPFLLSFIYADFLL